MVLGSFAETLLLKSPLPVWVFGHGGSESFQLNKILFATDFSDPSELVLKSVSEQAKALGSEVILYHKVTLPQKAMLGIGMASTPYVLLNDYLPEQKKWAEGFVAQWVEKLTKNGIRARSVIEAGIGQTSDSILELARAEGVGAIAMASQSGPVAAAMLGSTARDLVRRSECPVWVFGPQYLKENLEEKLGVDQGERPQS